ncbi:hypothetical protein C1N60_08765 [Pantoea sp. SGAir0184]
MKERGMIFNAEMVRAVLDGSKTQTRRMLTPRQLKMIDTAAAIGECYPLESGYQHENSQSYYREWCPFGAVGDRLWVRETFGFSIRSVGGSPHEQVVYRASKPDAVRLYDCNGKPDPMKWTPSIHMRRKYSRITLEITGVRVERLQDISDIDAIAEGCSTADMRSGDSARDVYARLWSSIYGADSWQANPWVWVIEFKRVEVE